jgi:hypothetical protein
MAEKTEEVPHSALWPPDQRRVSADKQNKGKVDFS